jgi:thioredoxin-like negative regulator of GroEL
LAPVLDELARQYAGKVKFAEINVDSNPSTASKYGIRGVPALLFYKNGKLLDQVPGAIPKAEIERRLRSILN